MKHNKTGGMSVLVLCWKGLGMSEEGVGKVVAMEMALIYINIRDFWFLSKGEATCVVGLLTEKQSGRNQRNKRKAWFPESNDNWYERTTKHKKLRGDRRSCFFPGWMVVT